LNLRLCSVCEAINAHSAERCHSCNAEFRAEREVAAPLEAEAVPHRVLAQQLPAVGKALPAVWRMAADRANRRSTKFAAALSLVPLLGAGLAYYFYPVFQAAPKSEVAHKVEAARKSDIAPKSGLAPKELAKPQTAELKQAPAPAVSGRLAPPKAAPAPIVRNAPPSELKRKTTAVTHTRAAGADASMKATAVALPVAATPVPAARATVLPRSEPPAAIPERRRVPVTHTNAVITGAAAANTAQATASEGRSVPAETRIDEPPGCAAAVAALGLCKSK
jgi:hypothetical protein